MDKITVAPWFSVYSRRGKSFRATTCNSSNNKKYDSYQRNFDV